jgi:hypothetical protein
MKVGFLSIERGCMLGALDSSTNQRDGASTSLNETTGDCACDWTVSWR